MATRKLNKLATSIAKIDKLVPEAFRPLGYSLAFNSMVSGRLLLQYMGHLEPIAT